MHSSCFGEHFTWGVASSAYQTEGASVADGKGLSIWDVYTSLPQHLQKGMNAGNACDFYNKYMHDIILMHYMNVKNFRFSISWSRIMPEGAGRINEQGIDFYNRVIDFCLEMGIKPWITLYHWDLPYALELMGGWTNRNIIRWFSDYVELCVKKFGDRVTNWMVLNEPLVFTGAGYFMGIHAPGKKGLSNFLPAVHNAVLCQSIGGKIIQSHKGLQAGTTFSCAPVDPMNTQPQHAEAAHNVDVLTNRMFIEPLLGLGYPVQDLKLLNQLEKYMLQGDEKLMQCSMDFIGIQNYTREVVRRSSLIPYVGARLVKASKRGAESTAMDWEVYPEGMYRMLKRFSNYKAVKKIIITENGASFHDELLEQKVHDPRRIAYLQTYLAQVLKAKEEGVPVAGYFAWSFTDNFEWGEAYSQRFGLVYVDYKTQRRYIKSSGHWFKDFLGEVVTKNAHRIAV